MADNELLLVETLKAFFEAKANHDRAEKNKAYMKYHFPFIGLVTAERREITKDVIKLYPLMDINKISEVVEILWQKEEREYHHAGIDVLAYYHKLWNRETIELIEYCLKNQSWWDSVDNLNIACVGKYFQLFPNEVKLTTTWNNSDNFWLQRSSIIFQKAYKKKTDKTLLAKHILRVADSKEFFVRKAIGWALREYAKVDRDWVIDFLANHPLHSLSKREAMKHLG